MKNFRTLLFLCGFLLLPALSAPAAELTATQEEMAALRDQWLANPEEPVAAHPDAAVYPGAVKAGAVKIDRTVKIDLSVPRWHSTGVYALPGEPLTVEIENSLARKGLKVRVGVSPRDLSGLAEWRRHPVVSCEVPLTKKKTVVYNPFGGLVHIIVPDAKGFKGAEKVRISGGIMAPWFRLNFSTPESFRKECQETAAPYGELEGRNFVIMSETKALKKAKKIPFVLQYWDRVLDVYQDLAQWKERRSPERICSDVQLTAGWMHSGYPVMTHINEQHFDLVLDLKELQEGLTWGIFHELGHNHQSTDWTPMGMGEVTVNLFTAYAVNTVGRRSYRERVYSTSADQAEMRVREWLKNGQNFDLFLQDPFLGIEPFLRIQEAYGWEVYKKTFAEYRKPGFHRPSDDFHKWQILVKQLSKAAHANLGEALAAWTIPVSEETLRYCAQFPAAKPSITKGLPRMRTEKCVKN